MKPIISVNIPCLNRKDMLRECIESFIAQTFKNFEIVVADDGSTEDISFVKDMDSRIKYVRQEHHGMAKAYNLALDNSIGDYIVAFGSDDIVKSNFLEEMYNTMEEYKDRYDAIYCGYFMQKENGKFLRKVPFHTLPQEQAYQEMLIQQYIPHCGIMIKKEKHLRYDETLESAVDWELMLSSLENGVKFKRLKKKLVYYRVGHPREFNTQRQNECCEKVLNRRGYTFNLMTRKGEKI